MQADLTNVSAQINTNKTILMRNGFNSTKDYMCNSKDV